jgi:hypothetical protein
LISQRLSSIAASPICDARILTESKSVAVVALPGNTGAPLTDAGDGRRGRGAKGQIMTRDQNTQGRSSQDNKPNHSKMAKNSK